MADILYTIEYDNKDGFRKGQHITKIGTTPDRVGFVTTKKTAAYLKKDGGKKAALKRNHTPFKAGAMKDPYIVPVDRPRFFEVVKSGKENAFRMICGEVDKDGAFSPWDDEEHGEGGLGHSKTSPSLPFPT